MKFIFDQSLVLYLPFYEMDGSSLMSRDAEGHIGTITGALWRPDGRYFDGSDDKIIGSFASLGDYPFTLAAWIKSDTAAYVSALSIGNNAESSRNFLIGQSYLSDGKAMVWVRNTDPYTILSEGSIVDGEWHFLVGLYHSPTLREMYLDGQYEGNSTGNAGTFASVGVNELAVGCIARSPHSGFWPGNVGEVWIYSRALLSLEVLHNYLATKWRYQ